MQKPDRTYLIKTHDTLVYNLFRGFDLEALAGGMF
jgi:hypothetical protein